MWKTSKDLITDNYRLFVLDITLISAFFKFIQNYCSFELKFQKLLQNTAMYINTELNVIL